MEKISKPYKMKKIKHGAFSTMNILVIIAILILINLVVSKLDISYDLTTDKLYSISDESIQVLSQLEEEINIYAIFPTNPTDPSIKTSIDTCSAILDEYEKHSSKVHVEYIDPLVSPTFLEKYATNNEEIANGSIIVESGENFKVIPPESLVTTQFDRKTFSNQLVSLNIEPVVTNAIANISSGETTVLYKISNHEEVPFPAGFQDQLSSNNYSVNDLDLFAVEAIPEDCELLFITTPKFDWSKEEADKVLKYLQSGGRAVFALDPIKTDMPNLDTVLAAYGVEMSDSLTIEANPQNFVENPLNLLPEFAENETASTFQQMYRVLIPGAQSVNELDLQKGSLTIDPLLTTSNQSYQNTDNESISPKKDATDISGPFSVATAITDNVYTGENVTTKIVVLGSSYLLDESLNSAVSGGNYQFLIDAMNWTQDIENSIYISPKTFNQDQIQANFLQILIISFISVIVIPTVFFATGVIVWLRRRNN